MLFSGDDKETITNPENTESPRTLASLAEELKIKTHRLDLCIEALEEIRDDLATREDCFEIGAYVTAVSILKIIDKTKPT